MFERGAGLEGEGQEGRSVELSPGLDRGDSNEKLSRAFSVILLISLPKINELFIILAT